MLAYFPFIKEFYLGGIAINSAAALTIAGDIFFIVALILLVKRNKLNWPAAALIYMIYFVAAEILSRALFIISRIYIHGDFGQQEKIFYFYTSQKVAFGIIAGLVIAVYSGAYLSGQKEKLYKYLDIFFLANLIPLFFSRLGSALIHYHPGKIASAYWGTYYLGNFRHEPALYEAVSLLVLLGAAYFIYRRLRFPAGALALFILCWMSLSRVITDYFRSTDLPLQNSASRNSFSSANFHWENGLTINQTVYAVVFLIALSWLAKFLKTVQNNPASRESQANKSE